MSLQRYFHWAKFYAAEEPQLDLVARVVKDDFPNVILPFGSGNGKFTAGFIVLCDSDGDVTDKELVSIEELAAQGYFVCACTDWEVARDMTLIYTKKDKEGSYLDDYDPSFEGGDEISLN